MVAGSPEKRALNLERNSFTQGKTSFISQTASSSPTTYSSFVLSISTFPLTNSNTLPQNLVMIIYLVGKCSQILPGDEGSEHKAYTKIHKA